MKIGTAELTGVFVVFVVVACGGRSALEDEIIDVDLPMPAMSLSQMHRSWPTLRASSTHRSSLTLMRKMQAPILP